MDDQHEPMEPTALYRCYDSEGELLYVGITKDVGMRWQKHLSASAWWPLVRRQTIDWYDSRPEAELAERAAIREENPKYNKYRYNSTITPRTSPAPAVCSPEKLTCLEVHQPCQRGLYGCFGESDIGYPCLRTGGFRAANTNRRDLLRAAVSRA